MDNAYKMLADLTTNTRITIDTALNFINGLPRTDSYTDLSEDNAEIRLKAKQIAQDLNLDDILSSVEKVKSQTKQRNLEMLRVPPQRLLKQSSPYLNTQDLIATGIEKSKLYAEAQTKTRKLEAEIREEVIAQRAKELADRQRIRIQEEARLLVEKEREKAAKLIEEQKKTCRIEALEKCAAMIARRKQVIIATHALASWKAYTKILSHNKAAIKRSYQLSLVKAAFHAWFSHFVTRKKEYEEERQRLRAETLKSRMRMAETNYVIVLMKKTLLTMRLEAQRLQTRRQQEERRASRERRIQSFIQRIEISKSICLSQNGVSSTTPHQSPSLSVSYIEIQEQKQKEEASSINDQKPPSVDNLEDTPVNQVACQPTTRKLRRKTTQAYIDYNKRAAERKQERLRRLEEDRLAKEQAQHSEKLLQEELARQKAKVRKEQLDLAISYHAGLLLRIGFCHLVTLYSRFNSRTAVVAQRVLRHAFSIWHQKVRERLVKKVDIITKIDAIIDRIMNAAMKQYIFHKGFLPLLYQSKQRFLQADKCFSLYLCRRSLVSMRKQLHQVDIEAQLRGERLRLMVLGRTIIFAWKNAILELRRERIAEARQTEVYKLMRAQVAVQWEEIVDRFILESFPSFYDRFEPIIRSFEEFVDYSAIESLADAALCRLLHPSDDLQPQPSVQPLPSISADVQFQPSTQKEETDITNTSTGDELNFASLAALISTAKQITGQSTSIDQPDLEFTYDFSATTSRPGGGLTYATDPFELTKLLNRSTETIAYQKQ